MKSFTVKLEDKIRIYLSHRPKLYALIVGVGIVLFWRGVWHSTDLIHTYIEFYKNNFSLDSAISPWWDGPLSFFVGVIILYFTSAFTSSFIGNELILSGLRGEKRLNEQTESDVKNEIRAISDIKDEIRSISEKIGDLEEIAKNHEDK